MPQVSHSKLEDTETQKESTEEAPRLYPEDQARVDAFLKRGVNSVERKPFRPFMLLGFLVIIVTALSLLSLALKEWAGIY